MDTNARALDVSCVFGGGRGCNSQSIAAADRVEVGVYKTRIFVYRRPRPDDIIDSRMESLRYAIQHVGFLWLAICLATFSAASPPGFKIHNRCYTKTNELHCSRANAEDITSENFDEPVEKFECLNCEISQLDENLFGRMQLLKKVYFSGQNITRVDEAAFHNLTDLIELVITNTTIHFLPGKSFDRTELLEILDLRSNSLTTIDNYQFKHLSELRSLLLSRNKLIDIDEGTFQTLRNLKLLDLSENSIDNLKPKLLQHLRGLENFSMSENPISSIPDEFFEGLDELRFINASKCHLKVIGNLTFSGPDGLISLDLSGNKIASIQDSSFKNLTNLTVLDLSDNLLTELSTYTFEGLDSLEKLYLQNNRLMHLKFGLFKSVLRLTVLNISHNSFKYISTDNIFVNLTNLQILDISHNLPTLFAQTMFPAVSNLKEITMDEPTFRTQGFKNILGDLKALERINLYNYSWTCAKLDTFRTFLKTRNIELKGYGIPKVNDLNETCVEPHLNITDRNETSTNDSKPILPKTKKEKPEKRVETTTKTTTTPNSKPSTEDASKSTTLGPLKINIGLQTVREPNTTTTSTTTTTRTTTKTTTTKPTTPATNKILIKILERLDSLEDYNESNFALQIIFVVLLSIVLVLLVGVILLLKRKNNPPANDGRSVGYVDDAHMELLAS